MNKLIIILAAALLPGCALLSDQVQESADTIGQGVARYCANMPASERPAFRKQIEDACNCTIALTCPE